MIFNDVISQIGEAFHSYAENNAFCINKTYYTYQEVSNRVAGIQNQIKENAPTEHLFGVIAYNSIDTYTAILAILLSGKGYVPIHPEHPKSRNDATIEQSSISWIISSNAELVEVCSTDHIKFINPAQLVLSGENPVIHQQPLDAIAYLLFTSGTTGIPKGVPISRKNLFSFFDGFSQLNYPLDASDRCLQMFDLTFDLSVMSYLAPLAVGACVYTVPSGSMKFAAVFNVLEEHEITFSLMVPSFIQFLRPYFDEVRLEKMKVSLFCGEALNDSLVKEWQGCVPNAIVENVYGPTEATIFCTTYPCVSETGIKA